MSKYRIKIVTYKNGRKGYFAQIKGNLWGWNGLTYDGEVSTGFSYESNTREKALDRIDKHYEGNTDVQTIEFEYINK